jgi:hypothetical protein
VEFCTEEYHKHTHKLCMERFRTLTHCEHGEDTKLDDYIVKNSMLCHHRHHPSIGPFLSAFILSICLLRGRRICLPVGCVLKPVSGVHGSPFGEHIEGNYSTRLYNLLIIYRFRYIQHKDQHKD